MTRYFPVPFNIVVPNGTSRNLCSSPLLDADQIIEILMTWPPGAALNFLYQFYLISKAPALNTVNPGGGELTRVHITPGYFAGDGITYVVPFNQKIDSTAPVLCMYATNRTAGPLTAQAVATLSGPD
jgi:hypothetical protein